MNNDSPLSSLTIQALDASFAINSEFTYLIIYFFNFRFDKMSDDIDIEEHDVLDNPRIKNIFPDITSIKTEVIEYEGIYNIHLCYFYLTVLERGFVF